MSKQALNKEQISSKLNELNASAESDANWALKAGKLHREFSFSNFVEAFGFMTRSAIHAEKLNHHPEWSNVYKTVDVNLVTHDANGITDLDFDLASRMNKLADA